MNTPLIRTEQRIVLRKFSEVITQEGHNLLIHPELLWQQVYNRLQLVATPEKGQIKNILDTELSRRIKKDAVPWILVKTPRDDLRMFSVKTNLGSFICNHLYSFEDIRSWDITFETPLSELVESCGFIPRTVFPLNSPHNFLFHKESKYSSYDTPYLVDVSTGESKEPKFGYHECWSISPEDQSYALGSEGLMRILCNTGEQIWSLQLKKQFENDLEEPKITCCAFSIDGMVCVFADNSDTCHFIDVKNRTILKSLRLYLHSHIKGNTTEKTISGEFKPNYGSENITDIIWSPDGNTLAITAQDMTSRYYIYLLALEKEKLTKLLYETPAYGSPITAVFNYSGSLLVASGGNYVDIYEVDSGKLIRRFDYAGQKCVFLDDEKYLALWNSVLGSISIIQIPESSGEAWSSKYECLKHSEILSLSSCLSTSVLASLSKDHLIITDYKTFQTSTRQLYEPSIVWKENGIVIVANNLYFASDTSEILFLDENCKDITPSFKLPVQHQPNAIALNPLDGSIATACKKDGTVRIWQLVKDQRVEAYRLHGFIGNILHLEFTPDGQCIALSCRNKLIIWDLISCKVIYWKKEEDVTYAPGINQTSGYGHFYKNAPFLFKGSHNIGLFEIIDLSTSKTNDIAIEGNYPVFSFEDEFVAISFRNLLNVYSGSTYELLARYISSEIIRCITWVDQGNLAIGYENGEIDLVEILNVPAIQSTYTGNFPWATAIAALNQKPEFENEPLCYGPNERHSGNWYRLIPGPPVDREIICLRCGVAQGSPEPYTSCPSCGYIG
jgi:WD40 repeat protein